jgi:hypothetical protein
MANKNQIKKFLESKKEQAVLKLKEDRTILIENEKELFFSSNITQIESIKNGVKLLAIEFDYFIAKSIEQDIFSTNERSYCSPVSLFNELIGCLGRENLSKHYLNIKTIENIDNTYRKRIQETEFEYDSLIAICQARPSSESIKALEEIGFDMSQIDAKLEQCTTLITTIDKTKLFV